jgi:hypothetical protein
MANEFNLAQWDQTSEIIAQFANLFRPKRAQPYRAIDFNPYRKDQPKPSITRADLHALKGLLPVVVVTLPKTDAN